MIQGIVTGALWCVFSLVMKERPNTLPSSVAAVPYEYLDFWKSIKVVSQNTNFVLLIIAFGVLYGQFVTSASLISNLLDPFGFTGSDASFMLLPLLFAGVVGALTMGAVIDRTNKH